MDSLISIIIMITLIKKQNKTKQNKTTTTTKQNNIIRTMLCLQINRENIYKVDLILLVLLRITSVINMMERDPFPKNKYKHFRITSQWRHKASPSLKIADLV